MEGRPKVTKEVLCEESRFILANILAEVRYGRKNSYDDIRRVCEGAVSVPFSEYVVFLEQAGYLERDYATQALSVTKSGETIVNGGSLSELTQRAVAHFKSLRHTRRRRDSAARPRLPTGVQSSGGRASAVVGGEIQAGRETVDSRYEKIATIGAGGIGTVYRAEHVPLGREVALKEIHDVSTLFSEGQRDDILRRFTEVVRLGSAISHPNVLPIYDVNLDREHPYVVSPYAHSGSMRRLISDAEEIPVALAIRYFLQALHALRAAHAAGVVHRGLKPENMLLGPAGNLLVSDFGFARVVERDSAIRQVYVGVGAVAYMAPELLADPSEAGVQADIYALGIIFYEMLTRALPGRRSPMPSEINASIPRGIDDIFDRMTKDARSARYPRVEDIIADLFAIERLGELLGAAEALVVGESPLARIRFRGDDTTAIDATVAVGPDEAPATEPGRDVRRPYSFKQRRRTR